MAWWREPLLNLIDGRRVIVAGGPAAAWTPQVEALRELGVDDVLVVATQGLGAGPLPQAQCAVAEVDVGRHDAMARVHAAVDMLADPPPVIVEAVEAFDSDRTAIVFGIFLAETPTLVGRPLVAHRRAEWVALEDKTVVDGLLDRAGVTRAPSDVIPIGRAADAWPALDHGQGTVWAADATEGFHGGGAKTRWITDAAAAASAVAELAPHCQRVRIMPFLDGIATSVHGIVLPDGVAALRPVELVTLRQGHSLRYSGCATFWDPPEPVRAEMRRAAALVGEQLRVEVGFRGAFTLDGVATAGGFRPTEVNPRFGAGLSVITRGLDGVPLNFVLDLVVAGRDVGVTAAELEREILTEADARRSGGTWQLHVETPVEVADRAACFDGDAWRWAAHDEPADGVVDAKDGFARVRFTPGTTPVGPSVGERAVAFWRFADAELGTAIGPLQAPIDVNCP